MKPLLHITSVPIAIEYKVTRAALKTQSSPPQVEVSRQRGQSQITTTPPKMNIDSSEAKESIGLQSTPSSIQEYADNSQEAADEATRSYAENGNRIVDSHGQGDPIPDIAMSRMMRSHETALAFIPSAPPSISVQPGSVSFSYSMDKLTFDWNVNEKPAYEYVPGNIEFTVTQHPSLTIEYLGGPIYAPPSADPDYVPPPEILGGGKD